MAIPYVKQTWTDGAGGGTPVSAARLGVMEQGIYDAFRQPTARVTHSAGQATTSGVTLILAFNSERFDTDTIHDVSTNNSRLTAKTAGVYLITANVEWAANVTGTRQIAFLVNGTTIIAAITEPAATGASTHIQNLATIYQFAVNDYVEARVVQTSGGALSITANPSYSPEFAMTRVST